MGLRLPHEDVFVRLGLSAIHGIGVFAIRPIPQGTNLFANDRVDLIWVDSADLDDAQIGVAERQLYRDFGINRGDRIGCPVNFNNLTPGWYLNEPPKGQAPNVRTDERFNFFARRDIEEGEELTVRYTDFSEAPEAADG